MLRKLLVVFLMTSSFSFSLYMLLTSYVVEDNEVYFKVGDEKTEMLNADLATFIELSEATYAKDKNQVYFEDKIIDGADSDIFQAFDKDIAVDKNNVYSRGVKLSKVDRATFKYIKRECNEMDSSCRRGVSSFSDKNGKHSTGNVNKLY